MGKGYFSLEEAPVNGSSVYTIVKLYHLNKYLLGFQKLNRKDSLSRFLVISALKETQN